MTIARKLAEGKFSEKEIAQMEEKARALNLRLLPIITKAHQAAVPVALADLLAAWILSIKVPDDAEDTREVRSVALRSVIDRLEQKIADYERERESQ